MTRGAVLALGGVVGGWGAGSVPMSRSALWRSQSSPCFEFLYLSLLLRVVTVTRGTQGLRAQVVVNKGDDELQLPN